MYVAAHNEAAALAAVQTAAAMKSARGIEVEIQIVPLNADQLQVAIRLTAVQVLAGDHQLPTLT